MLRSGTMSHSHRAWWSQPLARNGASGGHEPGGKLSVDFPSGKSPSLQCGSSHGSWSNLSATWLCCSSGALCKSILLSWWYMPSQLFLQGWSSESAFLSPALYPNRQIASWQGPWCWWYLAIPVSWSWSPMVIGELFLTTSSQTRQDWLRRNYHELSDSSWQGGGNHMHKVYHEKDQQNKSPCSESRWPGLESWLSHFLCDFSSTHTLTYSGFFRLVWWGAGRMEMR